MISGKIVECKYGKQACARFLVDLQVGEQRNVFLSESRAQHILDFYKFLPHGKGALAGKLIDLMNWHMF